MKIEGPQSRQPIPPQAKRVFKGVIFDVYQWEQKLYNGKTAIFEKLKRPDTAIVIPVLPDGTIVIADQEQPDKAPFIGLLGGRVNEEEPLEAAKRELQEESGYESDDWSVFSAVQPISKIDWTIYTFIARNCKKTGDQNLDGGEKVTLRTVSLDELMEMVIEGKLHDHDLKMKFLKARLDSQKMIKIKKIVLG
ncbi:MAG: NUDIX hydrolase [Patescibacteria group bacterium]